MSDLAIRVEGLSKAYRIGLKEQQHETMLGALAAWVKSPFENFRSVRNLSRFDDANTLNPQLSTLNSDIVWALHDVSFEVKHGEAVGIIGRNGAGKSTLLKILSRITEPTRGRATVYGRVASLLEVGTGFHPDLTGRENVYLNGTILGMKKREIDTRFDEIVDFSGVEKFIDTPVKRYSSGMRVRLAFAVAAHLEPEILIVDEVLAVGDAEFQKKCLGKMQEVAEHGRTVLFVSHNLAAVRSLCTHGLVLNNGGASFSGDVEKAIYHYSMSLLEPPTSRLPGEIEFTGVAARGGGGASIRPGEPFEVACHLHLRKTLQGFRLFCIVQDENNEVLVHHRTDSSEFPELKRLGTYQVRMQFPPLWLRPGVYSVHFKLMAQALEAGKGRYLSDNIMLDVSDTMPSEMLLGHLTPPSYWSVQRVGAEAP